MGIYIWGTGCSAGEAIRQGLKLDKITAFVDNFPVQDTFMGKTVIKPSQIQTEDVELMIITSRQSEEIRNQCLELGLKSEVLFFLKNSYVLKDLNGTCIAAETILGSKLVSELKEECRMIRKPSGCPDLLPPSRETESDYVRTKALEMLSLEVKNVPGAIAELGVFRGYFAKLMNTLLPERKLYLFDSFEGFLPEEAKREIEQGTCTESMLASHRNTGVEKVLEIMPYPEKIVTCVGYFPQSLNGLEEVFSLVSLDGDFEETTYEGLKYFWPRLSKGGYLMLHDYNSQNLSGVKKAVKRYEKDLGVYLPKVPICDIGGTLVLCKP